MFERSPRQDVGSVLSRHTCEGPLRFSVSFSWLLTLVRVCVCVRACMCVFVRVYVCMCVSGKTQGCAGPGPAGCAMFVQAEGVDDATRSHSAVLANVLLSVAAVLLAIGAVLLARRLGFSCPIGVSGSSSHQPRQT